MKFLLCVGCVTVQNRLALTQLSTRSLWLNCLTGWTGITLLLNDPFISHHFTSLFCLHTSQQSNRRFCLHVTETQPLEYSLQPVGRASLSSFMWVVRNTSRSWCHTAAIISLPGCNYLNSFWYAFWNASVSCPSLLWSKWSDSLWRRNDPVFELVRGWGGENHGSWFDSKLGWRWVEEKQRTDEKKDLKAEIIVKYGAKEH